MINVKRLTDTATIPTRNNPTDAGLDVYADEDWFVTGRHKAVIKTGIAMSIPDGYVARIAPRSSLAMNNIDVLAGVVDSSYRGEVKIILINHADSDYEIKQGDKIAQILIQPVELWTPHEVKFLDDTKRGEKGFGSSGK